MEEAVMWAEHSYSCDGDVCTSLCSLIHCWHLKEKDLVTAEAGIPGVGLSPPFPYVQRIGSMLCYLISLIAGDSWSWCLHHFMSLLKKWLWTAFFPNALSIYCDVMRRLLGGCSSMACDEWMQSSLERESVSFPFIYLQHQTFPLCL